MNFDWHPAKSDATLRDRGIGFDFAILIFNDRVVVSEDARRAYGEVRMKAIGCADGLVLAVVYTDRGDVRRIISARAANRRERTTWTASA